MDNSGKGMIRAKTLKDLDAKLARKRAAQRRVIAQARKRLAKKD